MEKRTSSRVIGGLAFATLIACPWMVGANAHAGGDIWAGHVINAASFRRNAALAPPPAPAPPAAEVPAPVSRLAQVAPEPAAAPVPAAKPPARAGVSTSEPRQVAVAVERAPEPPPRPVRRPENQAGAAQEPAANRNSADAAGHVAEHASHRADEHVDHAPELARDVVGHIRDLLYSLDPRERPDPPDFVRRSLGEAGQRFLHNDAVAAPDSLGMRDFIRLVAVRNDRVAFQKMEWAIARSQVASARGMYEPVLTASYKYTDSNTPNTTEEEFRRSFASEFIERNNDYGVGIEGLVPTGGRVRLSYTLRSLDNNIQPTPIRGEEEKSYVGLSLTQPLFRGAGGRKVVSAPILVAQKDEGIAMQTFRQALFETTSNAASVYWDVYLAERRLALRTRSVEIAERVVEDERERGRYGQSAETDVMDVESALAQRRVQYLTAQQELVAVENDLRRFVARRANEAAVRVSPRQELAATGQTPDAEISLQRAYDNRPEYLASLIRAEKEDVRVQFAKNNRLPQLDLVASYGLNGLEDSAGKSWAEAWDEEHKTYYVGLEYRMYLQGDKKAKGELNAAKLRKHQALLEIRAAEIAIHNSVDTALHNLLSASMQVEELAKVKATNERLMEVGLARFEAGQSNSRDLLELEERMNRAAEMDLESRINLQKALVGVALAEGTLLRQFELER